VGIALAVDAEVDTAFAAVDVRQSASWVPPCGAFPGEGLLGSEDPQDRGLRSWRHCTATEWRPQSSAASVAVGTVAVEEGQLPWGRMVQMDQDDARQQWWGLTQ